MADLRPSRSWFIVFNNPEEIITYKTNSEKEYVLDANNDRIVLNSEPSEYTGLKPEEICELVLKKWCEESPTRTGACAYCISQKGLKHLHMVLEDEKTFRFSALKGLFPRAHIEPTRGTKAQAEAYINKIGAFDEKGETVVCIKYVGEIKGQQGQRNDLAAVAQMIDSGMRPIQIMRSDAKLFRSEKIIKRMYFDYKIQNTPVKRDIKVYYHVGLSQSGKTFTYCQLVEQYGLDEVFLISNYDNGYLDMYEAQKYILLDEFRGQIRYSELLVLLQGYLQRYHCRNQDIYGLWEEVHICTVIPPERLYNKMVKDDSDIDTREQLMKRITSVIYHYKDDDGYHQYECAAKDYINYENLIYRVVGYPKADPKEEFIQIPESEQLRIKDLFG